MSHSLGEEREKYVTGLDYALHHVVETQSANPRLQPIILFGSIASGRRDLFNDLDI